MHNQSRFMLVNKPNKIRDTSDIVPLLLQPSQLTLQFTSPKYRLSSQKFLYSNWPVVVNFISPPPFSQALGLRLLLNREDCKGRKIPNCYA